MTPDAVYKLLPIEQLQRCQYQVRQTFAEAALAELAASIAVSGIIEPIVVRITSPAQYEIIAGERRWRAAQRAGLTEVPCVIRDVDDDAVREMVLVENLQREELNPIEEAYALQQLVEYNHFTHEEIAKRIGKDRLYVTQRLRLLQLSHDLQQRVVDKQLSAGHGIALITLPMTEQRTLAYKAIKEKWSVRKCEAMARAVKDKPTHRQTPKAADADTAALINGISEYFGAKVAIEYKADHNGHGRLLIDFHSLDELTGILQKSGMRL